MGSFSVSAVYCPPKHKITEDHFAQYFLTLGSRFVAGGDWNAKHTHWGSRLITTRGRELKKSLDSNNLLTVSAGEPTYWPTDRAKIPDLLDFFIVKGLSANFFDIRSCLDGSSDHTPVILTVSTAALNKQCHRYLHNHRTDWSSFREHIENIVNLNIPLKSPDDVESATKYFTNLIQEAAWRCTPEICSWASRTNALTPDIKCQIIEKRRLRRVWHTSRHPEDRSALNRACLELKRAIQDFREDKLQQHLESLSAHKATNYSLWRATKHLNQPQNPKPPVRTPEGTWARSSKEKADTFARYLEEVFSPNDPSPGFDEDSIVEVLNQDFQMDHPIRHTSPREVQRVIRDLKDRSAPGYDLITPRVLKELPRKAIVFLTALINAVFRLSYFPEHWKVSQIIMIHKKGKPPNMVSSYRPISLLPVISKVCERILLVRLSQSLLVTEAIPCHQFGFRKKHSTIEQVHRVYDRVRATLEQKEYCSAAFLDVQQAFDRVWHGGLLCKIKSILPHPFFAILKSYLSGRFFQVKEDDSYSEFRDIRAGVPQGSVLGPSLYCLFTSDMPTSDEVTFATFADDTAILASHSNPVIASKALQVQLNNINNWFEKWRIKVSASKSLHATFSLRRGNCPPVTLSGIVLPHVDSVRYLGMHLDRRLTWRNHIKAKRDELNHRFRDLLWLMSRTSKVSLENKLLVYKVALKPIWTYGIQLWGSASHSNIEILQRSQNGILKTILKAPWFITCAEIHQFANLPTVKQEIAKTCTRYRSRLESHPNKLAQDLLSFDHVKRLKRAQVLELDKRFATS